MNDNDYFLRPGIDYTMNNYENSDHALTKIICEQIETVYDPEFPIVDIFTLGLIYSILVDQDDECIDIVMTYTTPSCPEGEPVSYTHLDVYKRQLLDRRHILFLHQLLPE